MSDAVKHPVDLHVGGKIRERRRECRMTQKALASSCGISFQQLQKYESGENRVSASMLSAMAEHLAVSVLYFFDGFSEAFNWEYALVRAWRALPAKKRLLATSIIKEMSGDGHAQGKEAGDA